MYDGGNFTAKFARVPSGNPMEVAPPEGSTCLAPHWQAVARMLVKGDEAEFPCFAPGYN